MTSEARIAANQANSKKSTGPTTDEGKQRASLNAVKHGMRAETVVLRSENKQEFQDHVDRWMNDWQPVTETRRWLVERAAISAWKCNRCVRDESNRFNGRLNKLLNDWDQKRNAQADERLSNLAESPLDVLPLLQGTAEGVLKLIDICKMLAEVASVPENWNDEEGHHLELLSILGIVEGEADLEEGCTSWSDPDRTNMCNLTVGQARGLVTISRQLLLVNRPDLALKTRNLAPNVDRPTCGTIVREVIGFRIRELEGILSRVDDRYTTRVRSAEIQALKPQKEDVLSQRYEAHHEREVRTNLTMLVKLEKSGNDLAGIFRVEAAETVAQPAEPAKASEVPPEAKPVEAVSAQVPNEAKPAEPVSAQVPNEPKPGAVATSIFARYGRPKGKVEASSGSEATRLAS